MEINFNNTFSGQKQPEEKHEKVIILGSGPAGLSAALYAARAELAPLVITGTELGGQASLTFLIENYPGFPDGIGGTDLGQVFQKQAEKFGAKFDYDYVVSVDLSQRPFQVNTYNTHYQADVVIIATGASPNHLGIPGESEFTGKGVSYCATCDGWFFKEKHLIVVGGGDSALEEGLFLTRYASKVEIVHRRDELRAGAILQRRAMENEKIHFTWNTTVAEVMGNGSGIVEAVRLKDTQTQEERLVPADGVFIFIGHTPNTSIFHDQLKMSPAGYIEVDDLMATSVPGVFAAGEAADPHFRQVVTSAGMGAAAAISATRYLEEHAG
ncbi:MAG: thioredoxin-disulfide reductase [Chloroflexi bacterium]|jgi:thioredoxin reductase (NADPH)|nr:thioredoxin-disulfide reductase [Anaerolineaceae bacterium]NMB87009.1 thioredoxin-disulfide reductase [Chloroflexota bacterium]